MPPFSVAVARNNTPAPDVVVPWKASQAKVFLAEALALSDPKTHPFWTQPPAVVWAMDSRFKQYKKGNFSNNLRSLRKKIAINLKSIGFENEASKQHNINFTPTILNSRGNVRMHKHPAKKLLELDVAAGRATNKKPAELKKEREEYADFGTIQWCKAVNNERQKQRGEKVWIDKRNKEGAKRHLKRREAELRERGMGVDRND